MWGCQYFPTQKGTHEKLMKTEETYREMFERQAGWRQAQGEVQKGGVGKTCLMKGVY